MGLVGVTMTPPIITEDALRFLTTPILGNPATRVMEALRVAVLFA